MQRIRKDRTPIEWSVSEYVCVREEKSRPEHHGRVDLVVAVVVQEGGGSLLEIG